MDDKLEKIRKRAELLLKNNSINVLNDEKEIIETLHSIEKTETYSDLLNTTLDYIERYLKAKEKMLLKEDDGKYLEKLSEDLRNQNTRRTDGIIYNPLFKIVGTDGNEKYFLTRKGAEEHLQLNPKAYKNNIMEISENTNTDITKIIEILIRNF